LTFKFNHTSTAFQITLEGSFDLSESQNLKIGFEQLISNDFDEVSIDMSRVSYIDSSGVASILFIKKVSDRLNIRFDISSISSPAFRVLQLSKLDILLNIKSSVTYTDPNSEPIQSNNQELHNLEITNIFIKNQN